ncbi:MAG TPA: hypothetical protein VH988_02995 [Thermoanaerobaculia bacterium]|jgi:hypothetical protein|nr:hypothetical protein [Thermoanaerobaculia bacterium]
MSWKSDSPLRAARRAVLVLLLAAMPLCAQQMEAPTPQAPPPPNWPNLEGGGAYVLFLENDVTLVNGTARDYERGKALRAGPQEQLFWFQRGGKEYVLRDPALLKQLQALFAPQMKLGQQQAVLAGMQKQLANEMADIIAQQDAQGEQQAEFGLRMSQLATEQVRLQEQGESTEAIEAEIQGLEEEQGSLEEPQAQLAVQRDGVQQQQEALIHQQEDVTRKLDQAIREAQTQLNALVSQAVTKGTAKEVKAKT